MPGPESVQNLHDVIVDETYNALQDRFTREGKGRRPDVAAPPLTNKVLTQLWDIMVHGGFEQKKVLEWFGYLYHDHPLKATDRLRHLICGTYTKAVELISGPGDIFNSFVHKPFNINFTTDALLQIGLDRSRLLSEEKFVRPENIKITNEIALDLEKFQNSEKLNATFAAKWISILAGNDETESDKKSLQSINNRIGNVKLQKRKLQSNKKLTPEILLNFLQDEFILTSKFERKKLNKKCIHERDVAILSKALNKVQKDQTVHEAENQNLNSLLKDEINCRLSIQTELQESCMKRDEKDKEIILLQQKLDEALDKINSLKKEHSKTMRNLQNKHKVIVSAFQRREEFLLKKVSRLKLNQKLKAKETCHFQKQDITTLESERTYVDLKVKNSFKNTYSEPVRQTAIALQSETNVSADNVKNVIEIVSKYLFKQNFKEALPCGQTCINMLDEAKVISNIQVTENILKSTNVTFHSDGTSRDGKKIVGYQITLDSGEHLYLGYKPVATEDSQTLLEISIAVLREINHSFECLNQQNSTFRDLLSKITSLMSDRAASMKLFDKKFEEFLKSECGQNIHVHFLHCNAHFLLGLSSSCEKALVAVEKEVVAENGTYFGRDKEKDKFSSFQKEKTAATNRVIRTVSEVLGPRGDQKNGCRQEWITFCADSKIPSFKSNRFNCFFETSAAIILHLDKIKTFFTSGILNENINLKLQSVSLDIQDKNLMCFVGAVALFYIKVSAPYWNLVTNSDIKYSDFHIFVKLLQSSLKTWSENPADMYQDCKSPFPNVNINSESPFCVAVQNFIKHSSDKQLIEQVLKSLCSESLAVTERQLEDFLTDRYVNLDERAKEIIDHCPLTNLIGESAFGDYDFDLGRRRNATLHNRSVLHVVKRNKTMRYVDQKSPAEKKKMFSIARKLGPDLRKEDREMEEKVKDEVRTKFLSNQQKKIDKEISDMERNANIIESVKKHQGPCCSKKEITDLMEKLEKGKKSSREINEILKSEIRFHKRINGMTSLKFGDTLFMLNSLKRILPDNLESENVRPRKKKRLA